MQDSSSATPSSSAYLQHCFQHTYLRCTPENQPFLAFHWVDHVDLWFGHVWPRQESNGKPKTEKFEDLSSLLGSPWDWSFAAGTAAHMPKCGSQPTWMIFIQVARLDCMEWSCSKPHLQLVLDQCLSKSDGCGFEINIFLADPETTNDLNQPNGRCLGFLGLLDPLTWLELMSRDSDRLAHIADAA